MGTHDNPTGRGWYEDMATPREREQADIYLHRAPGEPIGEALACGIASSVSDTCIHTMQDLLGLGNEARMNIPATLGGNWCWRMRRGAITYHMERYLRMITETYFRVPKGDK